MSLFQKAVLQKYLNELDRESVAAAYEKFNKHFGNKEIQDRIRNLKEEEYQEGFMRDLFVNVLGYTLNPQPKYNLVLEKKNVNDSRKADAAILAEPEGSNVLVAIELKGTDTVDLDHVVTQAFGYKNNQKGCRYVIISNFEKLRFYIEDATEFEEFDLFNLSVERFALLYLCVQKDKLVSNLPGAIKDASVKTERDITVKLYKDYSNFKRLLYLDICERNLVVDKLIVYKKTQKLLDRFLFVLFAEDKQLLPANSIRTILDEWKELRQKFDLKISLYDRFKQYFEYMNTGRKNPPHDIFAYNGGLFAPDGLLDAIQIDDTLLHDSILALSEYDFETDVDVNILGHIFEHSLNDIDAITAETEGKQLEKEKTRRKKDGVFYTPNYITKYIVENTVGKLCAEKKTELEIKDEDYSGGKKKKDKKTLNEKLETYRQWLLQLTILDPACGSGAFLNQALDFLITEHRKVDELRAKLFGDSITLTDVENLILENNLYGVDLNEESIEIAKLSLWLRTARKGRKLSSLNNNVKCGNSLIDDKAIAGDKAFKWSEEFKEVFAKGGFDVVVGNPPYGMIHEKDTKEYFKQRFESFQGNLENYCFFTERFIQLAKIHTGLIGCILPVTWISIPQFQNLRKLVLSMKINSIVELPTKVFSDADLDTLIFILVKQNPSPSNKVGVIKVETNSVINFERNVSNPNLIGQKVWSNNNDLRIDLAFEEKAELLLRKIRENKVLLKNHFKVSQGIVPYAREDFYKTMSKIDADEIVDKRLWHANYKIDDSFKKELKGEDVTRYRVKWNGEQWVKYGEWLARPRLPEYFNAPRVLLREITRGSKLNAGYTNEESYNNPGIINIISRNKERNESSLKGLLAVMNSSFMYYYHLKTSPKANLKTSIPKILIGDVENLPIPSIEQLCESNLNGTVDKMIGLINNLEVLQTQLLAILQSKVVLEKPNTKLQWWFELEFKEFVKELEKAKVKLSLAETNEWLPFFAEQKRKALDLKSEIEKTDKEIDRMVYGLYELTEEEVKIVEGK